MKRVLLIFLVLLAGCSGGAQEKSSLATKKQKPKSDLSASVLTQEDLSSAMKRIEKAVCAALKLKPIELTESASNKPATREDIVNAFNKLFEQAKPSIKFTPKFVKYDPALLVIDKSKPERARLEKLIQWQFIAKVGPIAAGKSKTITLAEFGDALGFVTLRIADLTHLPSARWSPYLQTDYADSLKPGKDKSKRPESSK